MSPSQGNQRAGSNLSLVHAVILGILGVFFAYWWSYSPASCDLSEPTHRSFNSYYGITINHFMFAKQEDYSSTNNNIKPPPFFSPAIPYGMLEQQAFFCFARRGAGKSMTRMEFERRRGESGKYFLVRVGQNGDHFVNYIDHFVNYEGGREPSEVIIQKWQGKNFAHAILLEMVTKFVQQNNANYDFEKIPFEERVKIGIISTFYFDGVMDINLVEFLNRLFAPEISGGFLGIGSKKIRNDLEVTKRSWEDFTLVSDAWAPIRSPPKSTFSIMQSLYALLGHRFDPTFVASPFPLLDLFSSFLQKVTLKKPLIIVDGLDDLKPFQKRDTNGIDDKAVLKVAQSVLDHDLQTNFYEKIGLAYFSPLSAKFPKEEVLELQQRMANPAKIKVQFIEWSTNHLINYGEFLWNDMKKYQSSSSCKVMPPFLEFIGMNPTTKKIPEAIKQIPHPRALNEFVKYLITEMEEHPQWDPKPFLGTQEQVKDAFDKTIQELRHEGAQN